MIGWTPVWEIPPVLRCGRCGKARHVLDLVAHQVRNRGELPGPPDRCRNVGHLRCRGGCKPR